uniref:Uncharacterized protein n=1 Tax=Lactuca sativa TaxID=4236 RepID=A0A9R1WQ54_LACSA|nr:hypothetical protein LSAT_V11C900478510 [Lactuca sativa]
MVKLITMKMGKLLILHEEIVMISISTYVTHDDNPQSDLEIGQVQYLSLNKDVDLPSRILDSHAWIESQYVYNIQSFTTLLEKI